MAVASCGTPPPFLPSSFLPSSFLSFRRVRRKSCSGSWHLSWMSASREMAYSVEGKIER